MGVIEMRNKNPNHSVVRDPVCGTVMNKETASTTYSNHGTILYFCSEFCRYRFSEKPNRYLGRRRHKKLPPRMNLPIGRIEVCYPR
jgi:YHS domain-containing protein